MDALSETQIEAINTINQKAAEVEELLRVLTWETYRDGKNVDGHVLDSRWLAIGRTHLQEGFMAVIRSIKRPETF